MTNKGSWVMAMVLVFSLANTSHAYLSEQYYNQPDVVSKWMEDIVKEPKATPDELQEVISTLDHYVETSHYHLPDVARPRLPDDEKIFHQLLKHPNLSRVRDAYKSLHSTFVSGSYNSYGSILPTTTHRDFDQAILARFPENDPAKAGSCAKNLAEVQSALAVAHEQLLKMDPTISGLSNVDRKISEAEKAISGAIESNRNAQAGLH